MNDKKRSLRMRFIDPLTAKGFGGMKISFNIPPLNNRFVNLIIESE